MRSAIIAYARYVGRGEDMNVYKDFLASMCDIENVSVKELMQITGKSRPVVYSWLNLSKGECFPTIETLGKILFRLGISFDDFINCHYPIYDNGQSARTYFLYIYGSSDDKHIGRDLLELPNADKVITTYLDDRKHLNKMINYYLNGVNIDLERFDLLCKALMPYVVTSVITSADQTVFPLISLTLYDYKLGLDTIKETEEEYGDDITDFDTPMHQLYYPQANDVILLAAQNGIKVLNDYLSIADESDKRLLLQSYLEIRSNNLDYDKKNKIFKKLIQNKCEFYDSEDKKATEKYRELLEMIVS